MTDPQVPLFDIRVGEQDRAAVDEVLRGGWLTMGPRTAAFEREFAEHLGVRHAVAVSSGTAALHLALLGAGVGPGDEVIVPAITFVATANAARYCGATPVLADVLGAHDLGVDPGDVERRIGPRTKAVCVVHYGGYAADVERLRAICAERGVALIEDAAHSPDARPAPGARRLGGHGLAGAFSFFSNKVLSCGEGGLVASDDDHVASVARSLRSHGLTSGTWDRHRGHALTYDVVGLGFNYRIDEPRAALLSSRLRGLAADVAARRRLVRRYRAAFADIEGLTVPYADEQVETSSCYVMPVVLDRTEWQAPLRERMLDGWGVQTSLLYPALQGFTAFAGAAGPGELPRSELIAGAEVTIPLYPHLSDGDQERVIEALTQSLGELRRAGPRGRRAASA